MFVKVLGYEENEMKKVLVLQHGGFGRLRLVGIWRFGVCAIREVGVARAVDDDLIDGRDA